MNFPKTRQQFPFTNNSSHAF